MGKGEKRTTLLEDAGTTIVADSKRLGFDPEIFARRVHIQPHDLDGGTATIEGLAPDGSWLQLATGLADGAVHMVKDPWPQFRVTVSGGGGGLKVYFVGYASGWWN